MDPLVDRDAGVLVDLGGARLLLRSASSRSAAMSRCSASGRRFKIRSSASSRSCSSMSMYGIDVRRVDHRHVEAGLDAVVQEDRVEHRARAAATRPNETFETPSDVSTPGSSRLIRRMPSIVSTARVDPLLVAGGERERQRVEDQVLRRAGRTRPRRCRGSRARPRSFSLARLGHARPRRWSARRPRRRARRRAARTPRCASRPFSMLIELTIARPGYVSSAAHQRVGLERVDHQRRLDAHRELLDDDRASGRPRRRARSAPRRRRGSARRYSTWSRATPQHAVVVVGEQRAP